MCYAITNPRVNRWHVITEDLVKRLSKKSTERIEENEEFAELFERIEEREKNAGEIILSEMNKKREEARENAFRIHPNAPPLETVLELAELTFLVAWLAEKRGIVLDQAADLDGEVLTEPGDP